ncbi:MAG: hypothetical protein KKA19_01845, partial [Candidatus Margulisbacteria bacterium]|nr:hypothetical protein [Candidatus Margulisiibacteriota bacterium]
MFSKIISGDVITKSQIGNEKVENIKKTLGLQIELDQNIYDSILATEDYLTNVLKLNESKSKKELLEIVACNFAKYAADIAMVYAYYVQSAFKENVEMFSKSFPGLYTVVKYFREFNIKDDQAYGRAFKDELTSKLRAQVEANGDKARVQDDLRGYIFIKLAEYYYDIVKRKVDPEYVAMDDAKLGSKKVTRPFRQSTQLKSRLSRMSHQMYLLFERAFRAKKIYDIVDGRIPEKILFPKYNSYQEQLLKEVLTSKKEKYDLRKDVTLEKINELFSICKDKSLNDILKNAWHSRQHTLQVTLDNEQSSQAKAAKVLLTVNADIQLLNYDADRENVGKQYYKNDFIYISPHNDDTMWGDRLLNYISKNSIDPFSGKNYERKVWLMAEDCGGMDYFSIYLDSLAKLEGEINKNPTQNPLDIVDSKLGDSRNWSDFWSAVRFEEFYQGNPDGMACPGFKHYWYQPIAMKTDAQGTVFSYLSDFNDISIAEREAIKKNIEEVIQRSIQKECKTILIIPYIFDFHPVHRMIAQMYVHTYAKIKAEHPEFAKHMELMMYISGDGGKRVLRGNRYFLYSGDDLDKKYNNWRHYTSQIIRRIDYADYNINIDVKNFYKFERFLAQFEYKEM